MVALKAAVERPDTAQTTSIDLTFGPVEQTGSSVMCGKRCIEANFPSLSAGGPLRFQRSWVAQALRVVLAGWIDSCEASGDPMTEISALNRGRDRTLGACSSANWELGDADCPHLTVASGSHAHAVRYALLVRR